MFLENNPNRYKFNALLLCVNVLGLALSAYLGSPLGVYSNIICIVFNAFGVAINLALRPYLKEKQRHHLIRQTIGE